MRRLINEPFVTEEISSILQHAEKLFDNPGVTASDLREAAEIYSVAIHSLSESLVALLKNAKKMEAN